jgi:hypothetical protein
MSLPDAPAVISACGRYRYLLTRRAGPGDRAAAFVLLNPSTADAATDDPTVRRCLGFARRWGCGRVLVLNLFAFRATHPADLRRAADPVGPQSRRWFHRVFSGWDGGPVVCGWGVHGTHRDQDRTVRTWLAAHRVRPQGLGTTRDGHPRHPLYVPYSAELVPFG